MNPDLAIRDVRIVDGTGAPAFEGDVAVEGGRISHVGHVRGAREDLDGRGLVLAPGFVDVHTHDDGALLRYPGLEFKLAQGCTSLVIGNCGFSAAPATPGATPTGGAAMFGGQPDWADLAGFADAVNAVGPACNAVALVGHNTVRSLVMGLEQRAPSAAELTRMREMVRVAMEHGGCGFSTGLIYEPGRYSATDEVIELTREVAPFGGVYATHMRNEADRLLESVEETLTIGREADVAVQISHHKAAGRRNWGKVSESLARVDRAVADEGLDVTFDVYPYTAGSGPMAQYFRVDRVDAALAEVIRFASCPAFPGYEGRMATDVAAEAGEDVTETIRRVLTAPEGDRTICIHFTMDDADVVTNLRHPRMMVGSDGIPDLRGTPHPRLFGTFPRVLGEYVRERQVVGLEEAVRRMTSLACERFGIPERGRVAEGHWADLVVFDPATVRDTATYEDPKQEPAGVAWVLVGGQVAYDHGRHSGVGAGRLLQAELGG